MEACRITAVAAAPKSLLGLASKAVREAALVESNLTEEAFEEGEAALARCTAAPTSFRGLAAEGFEEGDEALNCSAAGPPCSGVRTIM